MTFLFRTCKKRNAKTNAGPICRVFLSVLTLKADQHGERKRKQRKLLYKAAIAAAAVAIAIIKIITANKGSLIIVKILAVDNAFKDDIRQLTDLKQQISQKIILLCSISPNVNVLCSDVIFCDICCFRSESWRVSSIKAG